MNNKQRQWLSHETSAEMRLDQYWQIQGLFTLTENLCNFDMLKLSGWQNY